MEEHPQGLIVDQGKTIIVNGEFNEVGKHFLIVTWYDRAKQPTDFFPIAQEDIDHIMLE